MNVAQESIQNANDNTTVDQLDSSPTDLGRYLYSFIPFFLQTYFIFNV